MRQTLRRPRRSPIPANRPADSFSVAPDTEATRAAASIVGLQPEATPRA
jgi:hypothetical protein